MIYIHKDYQYSTKEYKWFQFFCRILKLKHKLINAHDIDLVNSLEIKDDDILVARFAHQIEDKRKTNLTFPTLQKKFKKTYPSKESYYYYDDKLKQYEFMLENDIPCLETHYVGSKEDIKELNMNYPIVTKKICGAGSEQVNYFETLDSVVDDETTRSWTGDSIYPCLVQEYVDCEYDLRLNFVNEKLFIWKRLHNWKNGDSNNFPYGTEEVPSEIRQRDKVAPNKPPILERVELDETLDNHKLIKQLYSMQEKLNTNYMSWDVIKGKVLEFSVISDRTAENQYFDMNSNKLMKYDNLQMKFEKHKIYYEILIGLTNIY